ncbi:MAG TPA: DoxX family protein [Croceibacterium sp.]|nr:DoxX family protein [Croceibacterium sp.]
MSLIAAVIGRLLIAVMFIVSGLQKLADPAPTAQMLTAANLPATFALPTGGFEVIAGALLAIGLMTRLVAIVLAAFVALTIFFFHNDFADPLQGTLALKNLAIMGGLLMTFAYGQVRGTFDYMRERRRTYDAELRAARAEGRAEGAAAVPRTVAADTPRTVVTDVDGDGVPEVRPKRRWF